MRIHCLQHVPFEGPAYIEQWCQEHGHELVVTPLYLEEIMPEIIGLDMLLVMGGPMSVDDIPEHPWLSEEKEYILNVINAGIPTLGICLGAQLIAQVLGARVYRNSEKEIGWFPVHLHPEAESSPLFKGFPRQFSPFHWHGDTFDLPPHAVLLAGNSLTAHQGFFLSGQGRRVIALQFHLESTLASIQSLGRNALSELKQGGPYVQTLEEMSSRSDLISESNYIMKKLLDNVSELWNKKD